jgi:hypothetical protein
MDLGIKYLLRNRNSTCERKKKEEEDLRGGRINSHLVLTKPEPTK